MSFIVLFKVLLLSATITITVGEIVEKMQNFLLELFTITIQLQLHIQLVIKSKTMPSCFVAGVLNQVLPLNPTLIGIWLFVPKKASNLNDQVIESEMKIPNFASYKMMVIQIINAYAR